MYYCRITELEQELNEKELKLKEIKANMRVKDRGLWAMREKESASGYSKENDSGSFDNSLRRMSRFFDVITFRYRSTTQKRKGSGADFKVEQLVIFRGTQEFRMKTRKRKTRLINQSLKIVQKAFSIIILMLEVLI